MPNSWTQSLLAYRYPVDLRDFQDTEVYPRWFNCTMPIGDREETMGFEAHFRRHAAQAIEPWLEAVYWKMFTQPSTRGNKIIRRMASHFTDNLITPQALWHACDQYVANPTRLHLQSIQLLLGLNRNAIAVAATFPAFLGPDVVPMVDLRVARWVGCCMDLHNGTDSSGPQLKEPHCLHLQRPVLAMRDLEFVESWIHWCRYIAQKLTDRTPMQWRARDVEMAVFHAWGGLHDPHPNFDLNPLSAHKNN